MDTSPPLIAPVPMFSSPPSQRLDPPLPAVEEPTPDETVPQSDPPSSRIGTLLGRRAPRSPSSGEDTPPTPTSGTERRRSGGDPDLTAKAIGGAFVLLVALVSLVGRPRGRIMRTPTPRQRDDVAEPLARIACRHLPMDALTPDLLDGTTAAAALHTYLLDGPLWLPVEVRTDTTPEESP